MRENAGRKLSLDRSVAYQIKVSGHLDETRTDWVGGMTITVEGEGEGLPVTTLTGSLDQAALQGLLHRLYSLGLPLISVQWTRSSLANGSTNKH
ncbi:MAG: hypothetical protein ACK2U9_13765 [Anaerolineae bacterium]